MHLPSVTAVLIFLDTHPYFYVINCYVNYFILLEKKFCMCTKDQGESNQERERERELERERMISDGVDDEEKWLAEGMAGLQHNAFYMHRALVTKPHPMNP